MAGEIRHIDVGTQLTKAEWEATNSHTVDGGVAGDLLYFDGTVLRRIPVGAALDVLTVFGGLPTWRVAGTPPARLVVRTIVGAGAVVAGDDWLEVDSAAGPYTITLPTAVGLGGKIFRFKKITSDTNLITIDPAGAETVDGDPTITFDQRWVEFGLLSNDVNWRVL